MTGFELGWAALGTSRLLPILDSIASSLLLGVSGAGFFGTTGLQPGPFREMAIVSFCISTFAYMSTAIMSAVFLIPYLTNKLSTRQIMGVLGRFELLPKLYFILGYFALVSGAIAFFLCMVPVHLTFSCLGFCTALFIAPTLYVAYVVYDLMAAVWATEKENVTNHRLNSRTTFGWDLMDESMSV